VSAAKGRPMLLLNGCESICPEKWGAGGFSSFTEGFGVEKEWPYSGERERD